MPGLYQKLYAASPGLVIEVDHNKPARRKIVYGQKKVLLYFTNVVL